MHEIELKTERLLLRQWRDADLPHLIALNRDPRVMEFVGPVLNADQSKVMMERSRQSWNERGYGRFAIEVPGVAGVIGFVGLAVTRFESHFTPCVEIGWRILWPFWGYGYATEGAEAVMDHAITLRDLPEIVSYTAATNLRSRRVMEKIGLRRDPTDDFEHPNFLAGNPLKACVLYR